MIIVAAGNQLCVYNVVSHSNLIDAELRQGENKYETQSVQYPTYINMATYNIIKLSKHIFSQ